MLCFGPLFNLVITRQNLVISFWSKKLAHQLLQVSHRWTPHLLLGKKFGTYLYHVRFVTSFGGPIEMQSPLKQIWSANVWLITLAALCATTTRKMSSTLYGIAQLCHKFGRAIHNGVSEGRLASGPFRNFCRMSFKQGATWNSLRCWYGLSGAGATPSV